MSSQYVHTGPRSYVRIYKILLYTMYWQDTCKSWDREKHEISYSLLRTVPLDLLACMHFATDRLIHSKTCEQTTCTRKYLDYSCKLFLSARITKQEITCKLHSSQVYVTACSVCHEQSCFNFVLCQNYSIAYLYYYQKY